MPFKRLSFYICTLCNSCKGNSFCSQKVIEDLRIVSCVINSFLANLKCPTLVLGAELDRTLGVIASREIAEALERNGVPVELYVYENYGHAAYDEAPDFRSRILEFLKK